MQLEELLISLGIPQHIKPLSDWRDELLRKTAAELQANDIEHAAEVERIRAEAEASKEAP